MLPPGLRAICSGDSRVSDVAIRLLSFAGVGASGFLVDVACYLGLQYAGLDHWAARFASFWPAASWNWLLNRMVTFRGRVPDARAPQWAKFVTSSIIGLIANAGSYTAMTSLTGFFDQNRMLALVIGVGLGGLVNFALATRFVYRHPRRSPPQ